MKLAILASLASLASLLLLLQAGGNPGQPQAPKGSIEVVVGRLGSGEIVPGARLTLFVQGGAVPRGPVTVSAAPAPAGARGVIPQPPPIPPGTTNAVGRYVFQNLDEGAYMLMVQANGYVPQNYGQRYAEGPGIAIKLKAGQTLNNVSVSLVPAGNISGHLKDSSNQPLVNVAVQLLHYSYNAQGQRTYAPAGATRTDDHGEYRFYWVTPGRYYIMAGNPPSNPMLAMIAASLGGSASSNHNLVAPALGYAYFPGVSDITVANAIDLQPGTDLNGIDIELPPLPRTFRIRGRVVDSRTGQPPKTAIVSAMPQLPGLNPNSGDDLLPAGNYDAAAGSFEIRGLLPGTYTVVASMQDSSAGTRGTSGGAPLQPLSSTGIATVSVSGSDVEGAIVTLIPAASVFGHIRVDGQLPAPMSIDRLRVQLTRNNPAPMWLGSGNTALLTKPDGSFQVNNVAAGDYRISLMASGLAASIYIKDARFDGTDAMNLPLRLAGGSSSMLDIVAGVSNGRVSGVLSDQRSQPVPVTQVTLIPASRGRIDLFKTTTTDENGRFTFPGVPPGDYRVLSWEGLEPFAWFDPDVLAHSETKGHAVHVSETSDEMVEVKIVTAGDIQ